MAASGAVVITGASSGIGRATALMLADAGYHVFAGVRRSADGETLRTSTDGRVTPLIIDVTDTVSIATAAREVASAVGADGIAGLVNNAGIGVVWPVEMVPLDMLRQLYEVNVVGQVAVVQAFLPLLRMGGGRIINMGSIGDRVTMPFGGPLSSSKHAFASISDALRLELRSSGLHVILLEPASIHTEAVSKVESDSIHVLVRLQGTRYEKPYREMTRRALARERSGSSPEVVAEAVMQALITKRPKQRYLVGNDARRLAFLDRCVPAALFDLIRMWVLGQTIEFRAARPRAAASPAPRVQGEAS
jgi:NAD(P)-dependent dehydrogenase (short-subunit alcohol dehydrogenase family)